MLIFLREIVVVLRRLKGQENWLVVAVFNLIRDQGVLLLLVNDIVFDQFCCSIIDEHSILRTLLENQKTLVHAV